LIFLSPRKKGNVPEEEGTWERSEIDDRVLFGSRRFAVDAGMEGGSKRDGRLEEGDRGGHGPKTDRSAIR